MLNKREEDKDLMRAWLVQRRTEASRSRRLAELHHQLLTLQAPDSYLPLIPNNCDLICRDLASSRAVGSRRGRPRLLQRPATPVHRISDGGGGRSKTVSQPRPKTTGARKGERNPLFRVRDHVVKTSSSEEDDVSSSDDFPSTEDSDDGDGGKGVGKKVSTFPRKAPTHDPSFSRNNTGSSSLRKGIRSSQSAFIQTPKAFQAPRATSVGRGRERTEPRSQRNRGTLGQTNEHPKQAHGRHNSRIIKGRPRAQTTLGNTWELGTPVSGTGARQVLSRGMDFQWSMAEAKEAAVLEIVGVELMPATSTLIMERSKYEVSQRKVMDYLKSLTI